MSLRACGTCGYAVAVGDGHCRHCRPSVTTPAAYARFNLKLLVLLGSAALLLTIFLYRIFLD